MMQLPENTYLNNGKYHVIQCLGQGGYGITYLAMTSQEVKGDIGAFTTSVPVAVKEFFPKTYCVRDTKTNDVLLPTDEGKRQVPSLKKDFMKEAKAMSQMDHPNIVKVIDIFEDHQTAYYVMQYLQGRSLADEVGNKGPLPEKKARNVIFQIGAALAYLHDRHVCHYDVKPANIMLLDDGRAVLIDFGISRHYDEDGMVTTSRPVGYSGGFSSPEQRLGDIQQFSPSSDIYSLAATLFFLVTGKMPTEYAALRDGKQTIADNVTPEILNAIDKGLMSNPSQRPPTVKDWLTLIENDTITRPSAENEEDKRNLIQESEDGKDDKPGIQEENRETPAHDDAKKQPQNGVGGKVSAKFLKPVVMASACLALAIMTFFLLRNNVHEENGSTIPTDKGKETEVVNMEWTKKNRYGNTFNYTGTVLDSIPHGKGRAAYSDGSIYVGRFQNGMRDDDEAEFTDSNGNRFIGSFRQDSIVKGRISSGDGRYYEGSFSDDKPFNGKWYDADGNTTYIVKDGELIASDE